MHKNQISPCADSAFVLWGVELLRSPINSPMLQLAASLVVIKGIIGYTNVFLSSSQGAGTRVAFLNWEVINGFGENSGIAIIVLYWPAFQCSCIGENITFP